MFHFHSVFSNCEKAFKHWDIGRCFLCLIAIQCPLCSSPCAANLMILMHFERREDFRKQWIHRRPRPGRCRSCCSEILQDFGGMAPCFATVSSSNMRYLQTLQITELQRSSMDGRNIRTYVITQYSDPRKDRNVICHYFCGVLCVYLFWALL